MSITPSPLVADGAVEGARFSVRDVRVEEESAAATLRPSRPPLECCIERGLLPSGACAGLADHVAADHDQRGALQHLGVVARVGVVEHDVRGRALLEVA